MKITSIKQQVKNTERASIFIDGKYSFSLSLSELVAEKLKIGADIDEAGLKRLKKMSDDGKLRMRALEWVMNRPRSIREFKNYMFRKQVDAELSDKLIAEFTERNYLSEERFAVWLRDVRKHKGKSDRAIRSELASKGISREISDEVMQETDELERLREVIAKKIRIPRYANDTQKLMQYLARQGFGYDDIKLVLSELQE